MSRAEYLVSEFDLVGQLVDIIIKPDNRIKYLKIATDRREYWIKVSKQIGNNLSQILQLGCKVQIQGEYKQSWKNGKVKYKAQAVTLVDRQEQENLIQSKLAVGYLNQAQEQTTSSTKPKAKVLVCKKSTCWNRGGKAVCELLEESLRDRGLTSQVQIKTTGCLKQCKKGPNLVMMPDKTHYSKVQPQQVPLLIDKHLV
ncbi:iron-sulfur cluster-binding protein like protein [Stanieria cyanosphaera PCC 7437]|uniref:Iron-sulfur cluster-binding protein like protein n=1 Tax=Stanieria cyanosphaera (strain ATCC 29371 / PCC 7437) TaxID=111780 RepID=K9XXT8_STAC7|nr:(2Fe-2S) ferredoxin domain-containing protein [Stanieria cyanosphaera]AFZ37415.1 iron-sulfur cluster-binding protein like protein [Stanieria cyanosphaera PCC 7437]